MRQILLRFLPFKLIYSIYRYLLLKYKISKANRLHKKHKVCYYVVQVHGKLFPLNDFQIKELVKRKVLSDKMRNARNRIKYSLYYTK